MDEIAVLFHDISDIRNLQNIKKDFVSNVSHEMRTPLTAIKGYAETITGVNGENRQYLDIIKRHTDRLINIVKDLLILSELEERDIKKDFEKVDINLLLRNTVKIFEQRILEKGLKIELMLGKDIPSISADQLKLEQAFINLIDNAVKYTESGKIRVSSILEDGSVCVQIEDTGIGIPEKHLSRLFERFYTVDKSRSRSLGGTGLGLSIVKHIVLQHTGTINVESKTDIGTIFRIALPITV
jgi:two-component system phosphate regulon sensor histidine kinase PhoR